MAKYNRSKNISSGTKKYNKIKKMKENMTAAEKLQYLYSGDEVDIRDSEGILLMNSGMNYKETGTGFLKENKALTELMNNIYDNQIFQKLAQKTHTAEEMVLNTIDFNNRINISTLQKTKTFSSISDLKTVYNNFVDLRNAGGTMYIFDTETIGGKNRSNIWNPLGITEFAMQKVNLGTNDFESTNIVMGIAPTAKNREIRKQIIDYMKAGNYKAIENNEELLVTAKRVGLYAKAEIDYSGPFATISKLDSSDDNPWKDVDRFIEGWKNLEEAYTKSQIGTSGMRMSDEAFFNSIFEMQTALNNRTGMVMGQNFQIFDEKVINNQIHQLMYNYGQIAQGTKVGQNLSASLNITREQAQSAMSYMQTRMAQMGGRGLNMPNELTLDTLPFLNVARDYFGTEALFNGNDAVMNKAKGATNRQEFIGEAWFPELFEGNNAHMADFDVTVLRYLTTQKIDSLGEKTFFDHLMTSMGTDQTGVLGINDGAKKLGVGQVFYAKDSGNKNYAGKTLLNYTYNEKTGEVFTNAGYNFANGKYVGFNKENINMGTNLTKGQFYRVEQIKKVKAADIAENLGLVMPDMSGDDLYHVQFKMHLPENMRGQGTGLEELSFNYLFNSEKELAGFMSGGSMKLALEQNADGYYKIAEGAEELFDWLKKVPIPLGDGQIAEGYATTSSLGLSEAYRVNTVLNQSTERFMTSKAYDSVLDSDRSYKKIGQMRAAHKSLAKQGLENVTTEELGMLLDGKSIRNLTEQQAIETQKVLNNIFGFKNKVTKDQTLYSNTRRSFLYSWETVEKQGDFFDNVLQQLKIYGKQNNYNNAQKSFLFNELVDSFRAEAAIYLKGHGQYNADVRRAANNSRQHTASVYEYKNFFDYALPESFSIDKSKTATITSKNVPEEYKNVMRIDMSDEGASSYKLVDELRRRKFGHMNRAVETDADNRSAFTSFINLLNADGTFAGNDNFNKIVETIATTSDYNVNALARDFIGIVKDQKKLDPTFSYIRDLDFHTLDVDSDMSDYLNKITAHNMQDMLANNIVKPVSTRELLKQEGGMANFVKNNIMQYYMPSQEAFESTLSIFNEDQKWQKRKLYDSLYNDISAQLEDILSMTTRIEGAETYISKSGELIVSKGGKAINLASIPKIQMNNGHLYAKLGNQKLNMHLDIAYDENGVAKIVNNLGEKFRKNRTVSNNIRRSLMDGTFRLEDLYRYTNAISDELREQASYAGTSGELLSNFLVGTKELDKMLPSIFSLTGDNVGLLEELGFNQDFIDRMRHQLPDVLEAGELDPAKQQMMGAYRLPIMEALARAKNDGRDQDDVLKLLGLMNASSKEKSKLGKGIMMGGGFRFHTGFTNSLDENSRPVIGGSGNVYYLAEEAIKAVSEKALGTFYEGSLFESNMTSYINRVQNNILGNASTSFTGRTAYVGQRGIHTILDNNFQRIMDQNTVEFNTKAQKKKAYDFLYSFINTFEQAKVFNSEVFDQLTNGSFSANVQTLSLSKDIISPIDSAEDLSIYEDIWKVRGSIDFDDNGKIKYISDAGKIVNHGDAIIPYESFGGTTKNWVSKMDKGLFRYTVRDQEGRFLTDEQISDVLNEHINRFDKVDDEVMAHKIADSIFEEMGYKAAYTIEDINKTTLPKILVNEAEKSMNQMAYMRIGSLNSNIEKVLRAYGPETEELIGHYVPTRQALRAYFQDTEKANKIFKQFGFTDIEDFTKKVFMESYAANNLIFGKGGIFEGFVAIGNDNLLGHKNKGSIMTGAFNEAIMKLGKWTTGGGVESEEARLAGLNKIVNLINYNEDFQFFKNSKGEALTLKVVNGHIRLDHDGGLAEGLDDFDIYDVTKMENLFKYIDETYLDKDYVPDQDRLVHYTTDENGNQVIDYIGSMLYSNGEIQGSYGSASMKIVIDSETQSGMTAELQEGKKKLKEWKRELRQWEKDIDEATKVGYDIPPDAYEKMASLRTSIEAMERRVVDLEDTGHYFRYGDRERNVLSQQVVNKNSFLWLQDRVEDQEDALTKGDLLRNKTLRGFDIDATGDYQAFDFLEKELVKEHYFNPLEDTKLTKGMIKDKKYSHLKEIYEDITEDRGVTLGVEKAQKIYDLRMVEAANQFNNISERGSLTVQQMNDMGFDVLTPKEYLQKYGDPDLAKADTVARSNVVLDLGDKFSDSERYIAVPGMGAVIGDEEVRQKWHTDAGRLAKIYEEKFVGAAGNAEEEKKARESIEKYRQVIAEDTAEYKKKKGALHRMMEYDILSAYDRTKIMSLPDDMKNPLFERAMVDGQSLAYWRERGVYHDAIFDDYSLFKKRGFFDEDYLAQMGMTENEMIEHLQTHGAVMVDDRYPNIYDTSMTSARHYLFKDDEFHATNASYTTQETLLKMLGDSDGDSRSGFLLQSQGQSHLQYEVARMRAEDLAASQDFHDDFEREAFIRSETIKSGINADVYDNFRKVDVHSTITAMQENTMWHNDVVDTMDSDAKKVKQAQAIFSREGRISELKDGKSILGREKFTALNYNPTLVDIEDSISNVDAILASVRNNAEKIQNQELLNNEDFKKLLDTTKNSIVDFDDDEMQLLDVMLQGMEDLAGQKAFGESVQDNTDQLAFAENVVRRRVRINNYHNEIMSKLGISAVGNVNSAFYGASQAAKNFYGNMKSVNYDPTKSKILSSMATVIEQSSISSKKAIIPAGDGRVVSLGTILNSIRNEGLGDKDDTTSNYSQAMEWMRNYADKGKVKKEYRNLVMRTRPENVLTKEDDILEYMADKALEVFQEVWQNEDMKPIADAYRYLGTGNARVDTMKMLMGMNDDSNAGRIVADITGRLGSPFKKVEKRTVDKHLEKTTQKIFQETRAKNDLMRKFVRGAGNMSGSGMGTLVFSAALGLGAGLLASGYASGNPLNDANPETVTKESTPKGMNFGSTPPPEMVPNNTGGYIINIKGDTSKGNRQLKKALKQAAGASVGGAVNINMSLRTSQPGGYSDKDIENILNNYF